MSDFKLPLSGNVTQAINPWNVLFDPVGSQVGLVNINLGNSSNPDVEAEVLSKVASYGKQLGRIGEVFSVLLKHFHLQEALTESENKAIRSLTRMLEEIADVKDQHAPKANVPFFLNKRVYFRAYA